MRLHVRACIGGSAERLNCHTWAHLSRAQDGQTALIWAARHGQVDCAELLLNAGADTNAKDNVRAIARCFVHLGRLAWWMILMLKMGCDVGKHAVGTSVLSLHF